MIAFKRENVFFIKFISMLMFYFFIFKLNIHEYNDNYGHKPYFFSLDKLKNCSIPLSISYNFLKYLILKN
jgi:hypothetical protein